MDTRLPRFSGPSRNRTKSKLHLINSSLSLLVSLAGATAIVYFNLHSLMHKYVALLLRESVHVDLDYSKLQKYFRKMTLEAKLKCYDWYAPASPRTVPGQDPKRSLIEIMKALPMSLQRFPSLRMRIQAAMARDHVFNLTGYTRLRSKSTEPNKLGVLKGAGQLGASLALVCRSCLFRP